MSLVFETSAADACDHACTMLALLIKDRLQFPVLAVRCREHLKADSFVSCYSVPARTDMAEPCLLCCRDDVAGPPGAGQPGEHHHPGHQKAQGAQGEPLAALRVGGQALSRLLWAVACMALLLDRTEV